MASGDFDRLMKPWEVSEILQIPEATLSRWRYRGYGPQFLKMGKHVRYRRSAVEEWTESQTKRSTSEFTGEGGDSK